MEDNRFRSHRAANVLAGAASCGSWVRRGRRLCIAHRGLRPDRRLPDRRAGRPRHGSIDWLCLPALRLRRRASRRCSATPEHGRWLIAPAARVRRVHAALSRRTRSCWRPSSRPRRARSRVIDCMPPADDAPTSCASSRALRGAGADAHGAGHPLRLRLDRARGCAGSTAACCAIAGPDTLVLRTPCRRCTARTSRRSPSSRSRPGERVPFVLTLASARTSRRRRRSTPRPRCETTERLVARVVGPLHVPGPWREAVDALADHAQGADLRADRRHRRRADDLAARAARRRAQLGLSLSAGCATRRSRCYALMHARLQRGGRRPGATGCCARSRAARRTCRSCTASPASGG